MTQQNALLVALNALQAIDDDRPYPIAKHAIVQISKALAQPEQEHMTQPDLLTLVEAQPLNDEIKRITELNCQLIAAAKELGAADDTHEWDDAWSKIARLIKETT